MRQAARRALACVVLTVATTTATLTGASGHPAAAAVPAPAPVLTAAQLAAVQATTSWDFDFAHTWEMATSSSGGAYMGSAGQ